MADQNKIKEILRRSVRPGKIVTEQQLTEIAGRIVLNRTRDRDQIREFAAKATNDPSSLVIAAIDMGDIVSELEKDPPPPRK